MSNSTAHPRNPHPSRFSLARDLFIHLRLHYQILLAPIFLWGYYLADGTPDGHFWLAFLAFHVFLYGGTTAYNSYYDRDEGPVGGLQSPPPVTRALLPFSLIMQGIGAVLAAFVNPAFFAIYLTIFVLATAYSHPRIRWKGRPLTGLLTVALGQGVLAALGGWVAAGRSMTALSALAWLGILSVTLVTTGFYPITQIYQVAEDRARGDITFATWAGPGRTFLFALVTQGVAALVLIWIIARLMGGWQAALVALFYGVLLLATFRWARTYDPERVIANFRRVMRINMVTSLGFLGFLCVHLFLPL